MMRFKSTAALIIVTLYILPRFEAQYVSKQLRDALGVHGVPSHYQRVSSHYPSRYHGVPSHYQGVPSHYQGVAVHEIHEIRSLTDVTDRQRNRGDQRKALRSHRRRRCRGVVCENGGTIEIQGGQCVCSCPQGYVGYNCQYRGNCKSKDYTDCFLKQTHKDLTTGYWALNFQHHLFAARARYSKTITVTSEELYLGKPYKLTLSYSQKARHINHRHKAPNILTVVWKQQHKKARALFKQNFIRFEGITGGRKCVNIPRGFGEIRITFLCRNHFHCNIVPPHDKNYIKKKNTSFYLDGVNLQQGKC